MAETIYVTPDDKLQRIFDSAPEGGTIVLSPGIYRQKAVIRRDGLTLLGQGREKTILVFDDYARKRGADGFEYLTFRSFTLAVCADDVTIKSLAVVNDALCPEKKGQEIALSVVGNHFTMEDCRLSSTQDTLFTGPLPADLIERYTGLFPDELRRGGEMEQVFRNCLIEGTVDFIFGCGKTLFENCELRSLEDVRETGYVAAPAHSREQTEGYRFRNCRFTCAPGVKPGSVYLARPWRDYGLSVFENCEYGSHIHPLGFDPWNDSHRDLTARFFETPEAPARAKWVNRK